MAFDKSWGFEGLCMTNLFAYRATNPADMLAQPDPIGDENDWTIATLLETAGIVIAAWGVHGAHMGRAETVCWMLHRLHCL